MNNIEIDTLSRNRIVSETDRNFFVEAGAGSGKTTMLVNRMVAMVEGGKDISKICAITFTKAAAGEFYDRFQKLLIERANPNYVYEDQKRAGQLPPPTEETRKRCEEALQNIDLCFMGTIDSFCNMLLSEHPFDAKIPSDSNLITDDELEVLLSRILVQIGEGEYGADLKEKYENFRGMHRYSKDVFLRAMPMLLGRRNATFHYTEKGRVDFDTVYAKEKKFFAKVAREFLNDKSIIGAKTVNEAFYYDRFVRNFYGLLGSWNRNFPMVQKALNGLSQIRIFVDPMERFGPDAMDYIALVGKRDQYYQAAVLNEEGGLNETLDNIQHQISMTFLMACVPVIEQVMKEKGVLTYFDYLYYLRNMLKRDAEAEGKLIHYIYNRHSYFLIDEFQDTNPMQAEVFFYLTAKEPKANWRECKPKDGSIFIVGDPKQSIYRFRSADVTSFLLVKSLFTEEVGDVLYLPRNFRSTQTIINYFNEVFPALLPEETENQSKFESIPVPEKKESGLSGIYQYEAVTGQAEALYPEEQDQIKIGSMIEALVGNDAYEIETPDVEGKHPIRYKDIMVISYGKNRLPKLMLYLNSLGIPTKVEGTVPFETNEALWEVFKLYRFAADFFNKHALYGALTGKVMNLSKEDLIAYRMKGGIISVDLSEELLTSKEEDVVKVTEKLKQLKDLAYLANKLSPAALFVQIMEQFNIYEIATADHLEVLYYTIELIRTAEKSGVIVSHMDAISYLSVLLSGKSDEERCLSVNDNLDCVHMANLHKLKGLEAPVVILSASPTFTRRPEIHIEHLETGSEGWVLEIDSDLLDAGFSSTYFKSHEYNDQTSLESAALKCEGDRLIYVAATRVRDLLIICNSYSIRSGKKIYSSRWKPLLQGDNTPNFFDSFEKTEEVQKPEAEEVVSDALYQLAEKESALNHREAERKTYLITNPSRIKLSTKMDEEQVVIAGEEEGTKKSKDMRHAALTGTMVHRFMEVIVSSKNTIVVEDTIEEILREYALPVNESYEKEMREVLTKVAVTIQNGGYPQKNGSDADILSILLSADEVNCEVPFCFKQEIDGETAICNGVMDVIYKKDGKWHIVDYKTNLEDKGLDTKYEGQLNAYITAFKEIMGEEADARIYHIEV